MLRTISRAISPQIFVDHRVIPEARLSQTQFMCILFLLVLAPLAVIFCAFPVSFIDGTSDFWRYPTGDFPQHIIGGRYFIAGKWGLPLLFVPELGTSYGGTNIALTDSIPLVAVIVKLFGGMSPLSTYLPIWILCCYLLQGPAAAIALYSLGVRRPAILFLGGLIFLFSPILLARFGHAALCSHFLLLLALAVHFTSIRQPDRFKIWASYTAVLSLSLLVHIYLFAMVAAVTLATVLQGLWTDRLTIPRALVRVAGSAACIAIVMWVFGYFDLGTIVMRPYGQFPLDLASPFWPSPSLIFGTGDKPDGLDWESVTWLGAGVALLIAVGAVSYRAYFRNLVEAYFPTLFVAGFLAVFAVTYNVHFGTYLVLGLSVDAIRAAMEGGDVHQLIASLTVADYVRIILYCLLLTFLLVGTLVYAQRRGKRQFMIFLISFGVIAMGFGALRPHLLMLLVSNFQASARFIWVVIYLGTLLAVARICQAFSTRAAVTLLAACLSLQVIDTSAVVKAVVTRLDELTSPLADEGEISGLLAQSRAVHLMPTHLCAHGEPTSVEAREALVDNLTKLQVLVSQYDLPINSVWQSRTSVRDAAALQSACRAINDASMASIDVPGVLTFIAEDAPWEAGILQQLDSHKNCHHAGGGLVCFTPTD